MELDIAATESLRDFALAHGEIAFNHFCNAALDSEEWAMIRVFNILAEISKYGNREAATLFAISNADTSRPDGAIARSFEI